MGALPVQATQAERAVAGARLARALALTPSPNPNPNARQARARERGLAGFGVVTSGAEQPSAAPAAETVPRAAWQESWVH